MVPENANWTGPAHHDRPKAHGHDRIIPEHEQGGKRPSLAAGDLPTVDEFRSAPIKRKSSLRALSPPMARPSFAQLVSHDPAPAPHAPFASASRLSATPAEVAPRAEQYESARALRARLSRVSGGGAGGRPAMLRELTRSRGRESAALAAADVASSPLTGLVLTGGPPTLVERKAPPNRLWGHHAKKAAGLDTSPALAMGAQIFQAVKQAVAELGPPSERRKAFWCACPECGGHSAKVPCGRADVCRAGCLRRGRNKRKMGVRNGKTLWKIAHKLHKVR